ncbi:MAG: sodium:solute symporter [Candidatus Brocadiia bacterium]
MFFLGLHVTIWVILLLYFVGMLAMGWWSKRVIHDREGFLLGNRQFGVPLMVMHAFGAGTHPGDVAGVTSKTVERGGSGIWVSWMWMFGTPFYWLIAPIVRRMRCLTMADYFEERFGKAASALYVVVAMVGMTIATASVLLATTRTVQGMMGKAAVERETKRAEVVEDVDWERRGVATGREADAWFFGILFVATAVFVVYSYWGGIVAAVRTDMAQGLMIIALSFIAIPLALHEVGGWAAAKHTLETSARAGENYLGLFDPKYFSLLTVLVLCINAPFSMMAQPHLISVTAAGKTEWEGRMGFTYGNILKRICTMGWCILALCWLAFLIGKGSSVHPDAAFGDSVRYLLPHVLQGLMLACVLAAAMSSGDALQVTIAGLFSQNVYRPYIRPGADEAHYVKVTRLTGVVIIAAALAFAIAMRESVVKTILDYFNITAAAGIAVVLGILWRRMNTPGVFASIITAAAIFVATRYAISWNLADLAQREAVVVTRVAEEDVDALKEQGKLLVTDTVKDREGAKRTRHHLVEWGPGASSYRSWVDRQFLGWTGKKLGDLRLACTRFTTTAMPLLFGTLAGIVGSLLTRPPKPEVTDKFFRKIYVPIGQEQKLELPLDEAVPAHRRWVSCCGLFLVKPTRQSWVGFLVTLAICLVLVGLMYLLLS